MEARKALPLCAYCAAMIIACTAPSIKGGTLHAAHVLALHSFCVHQLYDEMHSLPSRLPVT